MCALVSGKYFFSKTQHQPELDDICDTTKYIDYQREQPKTYQLKTSGIEPIKLPNRTIMFFGKKSFNSRSSRSKTKTDSQSVSSTPKNTKHATFNIAPETPKPTEEERTETIIVNTTPEDPLESVSYEEEDFSDSVEKQNASHIDSDNYPLDEADDEYYYSDNSYNGQN